MSTTAQTPITKVGLIELGFEWCGESWHHIAFIKGNSLESHVLAEYWDDDDIRIYLYYLIESEFTSIHLRNLKTIDQLKTIIEVCL